MKLLELAVAKFGDFGATSVLISDLQYVGNLSVGLSLVVDYFWF
jgi:hypothetical protein